MATSYKTLVTYPLNGTVTEFDIPYQYLARRFIVVSLLTASGTPRVLTMGTDYRFVSKTRIALKKAWGANDGYTSIDIRRVTSATDRVVDFSGGSILRAFDLNTAQLQALHVAEEGREQTLDAGRASAEEAKGYAQEAKESAEDSKESAEDSGRIKQEVIDIIAAAGDKDMTLALASEDATKGDALVTVKNVEAGGVKRTVHDKNAEVITPYDFSTAEAMIAAAVKRGNLSAVFNSKAVFTLTVGAGGMFSTLSAALEAAVSLRPLYKIGNGLCEVKLLAGYVHSEQIEIGGAADYSWLKVTSVDSVVKVDTTGFTKKARTYYEYVYMFYIHSGAKSPVFAVQFEENSEASTVCAFLVSSAQLSFLPYSGARKFYTGVSATYGAEVIAHHTGCAPDQGSVANYMPAGYYVCDFSYCRYRALEIIDGSICNMPISKFEHVNATGSSIGVMVIYNSTANFHGSSASYCATGWAIRDGAVVTLRDHKTIRCTVRGLAMIHMAFADARCHHVEESDIATSGRVLEPEIEKGFFGCTLGVRLDGAGFVDIAGNDMRNCGTAVNADTGATISGKGLDVSGATVLAFDCQSGGRIHAPRLWATNVYQFAKLRYGCDFSSRWATISSETTFEQNTRFMDIMSGTKIALIDSKITVDSGLFAEGGSQITLVGCALKVRGVRSFIGANVLLASCAVDPTFTKAAEGSVQYTVSMGGFMNVNSSPNTDGSPKTLNIAKNTLAVSGLIFDA